MPKKPHEHEENHELKLLEKLVEGQNQIFIGLERNEQATNQLERKIDRLVRFLKPRLARVQIKLEGDAMANPITLNVGDSKTATVTGFDQFGNPFPIDFNATPDAWATDNSSIVSSTPPSPANGTNAIAALAAGSANLSVTVGGFSDSLSITVSDGGGTPVLSSVKITVA